MHHTHDFLKDTTRSSFTAALLDSYFAQLSMTEITWGAYLLTRNPTIRQHDS